MSEQIESVFGDAGYLAQHFDRYQRRDGQVDLAQAVADAIANGRHLFAEGPTGTGKSVGYLVPSILSGKRVVVCTANIALQEQLVGKDLPMLQRVLPQPFTFALLKGRNNYLCLDALDQVQHQGTLELKGEAIGLARTIMEWATHTANGDVSELPFQPPAAVWRAFSVGSDDCKGSDCRFKEKCYSNIAKARAQDVQVIVTNYHILFADMIVRQATDNDAGVLPRHDVLIMDEGHKAADIARDFLGERISYFSIRWAARMLSPLGAPEKAKLVDDAAKRFFKMVGEYAKSKAYKARFKRPGWAGPALEALCAELDSVAVYYAQRAEQVEDEEKRKNIQRCRRRCGALIGALRQFDSLGNRDEWVYFVEQGEGDRVALCSRPIYVGPLVRHGIFTPQENYNPPTTVVTSATLSVGGKFHHIADDLGLHDDEYDGLVAATPFNFMEQCLVIVPDDAPDANDQEYPDYVAATVASVARQAGGRTLGLFTSYRNLNLAYEHLASLGEWRVMKQGDAPRTKLVEEFKANVGSVLLGTESFWQGIDVPGEALSAVVIDRLPFANPDDPVLDAVTELEPKGWFSKWSLPRAVVAFKQGFGRLIRTVTDRGVVVCLDRRLAAARYAGVFWKSLPKVQTSRDINDVGRFLG